MPYLQPAQLRVAIGGNDADSRRHTAADLDDAALAEAIEIASADVDAQLAVRYRVPFDPVPNLVVQLTTAMAIYHATLSYRKGRDLGQYDPVVLRHAWARNLLEKIEKGHANLVEVDGDTPEASGPVVGRARTPWRPSLLTARQFAPLIESGDWDGG